MSRQERGPGPPSEDPPAWQEYMGIQQQPHRGDQVMLHTLLLNGFQGLSLDGLHAPPLGPLHPQLPQFQAPAAAQRPLAGGAGPSAAAEVLPVGVGAYAQPVAAIGGSIPHGGMPGMLHLPQPPGIAQLQQLQLLQQQLGRGGRKGHQQQDQEKIRRTVYVCDIDQQVSEAELAAFFQDCGAIVDCRICGDPNSSMRFAFIEFRAEAGAHKALGKSGSALGLYQLRVAPSKTAIVPIKTDYLPTSATEREAVARTIYVANIDKAVEREVLHDFLSRLCGPVTKLRLLGDMQHNSKIAFVEFELAASAKKALNCSGALLGALPLRISPSKTPVRLDTKRGARNV